MEGSPLLHGISTQILEQLSDEEFWNVASSLAHTSPPSSGLPEQCLVCECSQGSCILPLAALREVVTSLPSCTSLPAMPPWMRGLVAWRGEVVAGVDLSAYLEDRPASPYADGVMVVLQFDALTLALFVASVDTTSTNVHERPLSRIPESSLLARAHVVRPLEDEMFLLDVPLFVNDVMQSLHTGGLP